MSHENQFECLVILCRWGMAHKIRRTCPDAQTMVNLLKTPTRQLRALRADPEGRSRCEHRYMATSHVSGMERLVCEACGHVSIKRVGESVTKGIPASP